MWRAYTQLTKPMRRFNAFKRDKLFAALGEPLALRELMLMRFDRVLAMMEDDIGTECIPIIAYMLATVRHETSATFAPLYERGPRKYFDRYEPNTSIGKMLGNIHPGDGYLYRGRGYVQITGRANYERLGKVLSLDLVADPDAALDQNVAYKILSIGMLRGLFTGRKLGDYVTCDRANYREARQVVNRLDKADRIAKMAVQYEEALRAAA